MEPPATQSIETSTKSFQVEEDEQDKVVDEWYEPFFSFFPQSICYSFVLYIYNCLILFFLGVIGVAVVLAATTAWRAALITYAVTTFVRLRII